VATTSLPYHYNSHRHAACRTASHAPAWQAHYHFLPLLACLDHASIMGGKTWHGWRKRKKDRRTAQNT